MKKVFAIVLVACLAFGVAFAAKSSLKVGAQAGWGGEFLKLSKDSYFIKVNNGGFYAAGTFELGLSDEFAFKAEAGINTMGKAKYTVKLGPLGEGSYTATKSSPIHFSVYAGGQYALEMSKDFDLLVGAGFDALIGKESAADDAKVNAALGLGVEAIGSYKASKELAVTFGAKFGWHFINTDDNIADAYGNLGDNGISTSNISLKFFAGVTYAL